MALNTEGGIWKETNHGKTMSEGIRRLIKKDFFKDKQILELGGGIANHTVLMLTNDPKSLTVTEIAEDRMQNTRDNVARSGVKGNIEYIIADWLSVEGLYDMVVTNPPYFMSGKFNRRYFIDELILNAHKHLKTGGHLLFVQSSMADIDTTMKRMIENGFEPEIIFQDSFEWRDYYFEDPAFLEMCDARPSSYFIREDKRWETLFVVLGTLKEFFSPFKH
ncbi:MAG: methyltransferase [Candidatus Heimdallarchaeota archaeon]|nr:methyltransferase [Candidatus Heimdallarchaeota archaeon]